MEINDGYDFIGCPPPPPVLDLLKKIGTTGVPIHHQLFISHIKNWNKKMQLMELEQAFTSYEQGGDGKVSLDELKAAIPGIEGSEWTQILYDADINGDGMMTLDELKEFILANLNNS
jgi:Ca2+-binding EF-hand superfamily protein